MVAKEAKVEEIQESFEGLQGRLHTLDKTSLGALSIQAEMHYVGYPDQEGEDEESSSSEEEADDEDEDDSNIAEEGD